MDKLEHAQHIYALMIAAQYIHDGKWPGQEMERAASSAIAFAKAFAAQYEKEGTK